MLEAMQKGMFHLIMFMVQLGCYLQVSLAGTEYPLDEQHEHSLDVSSANNKDVGVEVRSVHLIPHIKTPLDFLVPFDIRPGTMRPPESTTETAVTSLEESTEEYALTPRTDEEVRNSDPFYRPPQAEQVNCTSIGTNCKKCSYVDWLKIYNKTIDESVAPAESYKNFDEKKCFQLCNVTISCVLYTFNKIDGTCKIHNEVKFENIRNDTNWSMFFRISPRFIFLNEWIITLNNVPRRMSLDTTKVSNFFECTVRCSTNTKCAFAALNRSNSSCSLYSKTDTRIMGLKGNHVSIQHISLSWNDNLWKFRDIGPIYQMDTSPNGITTESLQNCLEFCDSEDSCQLATTSASDQGTMDCYLYDNYQNIWFQDDPPTKATNSFLKIVSKNNTQYTKFPDFVTVATKPMETKRVSNLPGCHRKAINSSSCYWYSYNSTSKVCKLYDSSVQIRTVESSIKDDLTTFSKSIPTDFLPFYGFGSVWMSKTNLKNVPTSGKSAGQRCLGICLELKNCSAVAIQMPGRNCSFYTESSLTKILDNRKRIADIGLQTIQMFVKTGDPRFIQSESQFRCLIKPLVTWDEINQILEFGSLDKVRNDIPPGNNPPLAPHGSSFEGTRNGTTNLVSIQRLEAAKGEEAALRWPRPSSQMITTPVIFGGAYGLLVGGPQAAVLLGSAGAFLGVGLVVTSAIICAFSECDKAEEKETCGKRCARPSSDMIMRSISSRADDCICHDQPKVEKRGNLQTDPRDQEDDIDGELQENCDGKRVGEVCNICCQVGYEPEENPLCVCSDDSPNFWSPDPAKCVGSTTCDLGFTRWGNIDMHAIKVSDCRDNLYYGLVFNAENRIPFYTVYHYTHINVNFDNPKLDRSRWVALACTDIATSQLTEADYKYLNKGRKPSVDYYDKGHLTPNGDVRYRKDAVKATFVFANAAPQDHYSNSVPWRVLEKRLRDLFNETLNRDIRGGYVITGVCLNGLDSNPYPAKFVPDCFWKLACTRTNKDQVTVGGFYHKNIISTTPEQKEARNREVYHAQDQYDIRNDIGPLDIGAIWDEAGGFFIEPDDKAAMMECKNARIKLPNIFGKAADDYDQYYFWKSFTEGLDNAAIEKEATDEMIGQSESGSPPSCGAKVVGYITGWSDVKFTLSAASYLTHVVFAFVQMKSDGTLVVGSADPDNSNNINVDTKKSYLRLYEIKAAKEKSGNRLRTIFAVGGWANSQFYSTVSGSEQLTQNFIRTGLEILDYFNMDGIDIDWEYPVTGGANDGTKQDRQNYVSFLKSLKTALANHQDNVGRSEPYLLTIAGAAGSWVLEDGFDLPAITETVDWINVMTYDYNGAWESKWGAYTGPHAPLYFGAPQGYSGKTNVDYTMKYYSCRIKNHSKLVMGLGFYGRFWNNSGEAVDQKDPLWRMAKKNAAGKFDGGFEPWRSIAINYLNNPSFRKSFHEKTQTPYLENSSGFLMGYEDTHSIHAKVNYASVKQFAGVMIWAVDLDDNRNSLLRTASSESLCSSIAAGISPEYKCPPIQEQRWWTLLDDTAKAGMCGKSAPLYKGFYPVCDPEDPGYACCSSSGYCGSGDKFCKCDGCVDYYENPDKILDEPMRPTSPVRWHTMDKFQSGPQCGYLGHKLENGEYAICNPDDENGYCCSAAGYCGKKSESCDCEGCVNFKKNPTFQYPEKTWIDSGPDAGKCGKNASVNGKPATCNPLSKDYYCCSDSGYCGSGSEYCSCSGCVNYKN